MDELNSYIVDNGISIDKGNILKKMYDNNKNLLSTINIDFINSYYFEKLDFNLLQNIVSLDESIQLNFLNIKDEKRKLFLELINRFSKEYYQFPYVNSLLVNFNNSNFDNLLNSINLNDLNDKDYTNLSLILTSKSNSLNVQSIEEIKNIDNLLDNKINEVKNDINEYKNYMLIKKTNLSLPEIKLICQKYCYDLDHFHINNSLINDLKNLKSIVLSDSFEEIDDLISKLNINRIAYPNFQTVCQNLYEEEFNKVLFKTDDKEYIIYDGCKVIDAGVDFNMIIRANGAFFDSNSSLDPKEYWNNNIRDSLSFSTSLLSNSFLRNVSFFKDNCYVIGFSNIPKNAMAECCMGDNATVHKRKYTLDVRTNGDDKEISPNTGDACGQQFRPLPEMIKHGAGEYQEVTLERFTYDNDVENRIEPSYVLFFKMNEEYQESNDFKNTIAAAKSFNIPIVIIDVRKVLKKEKTEIENLLFDEISIDNIIEVLNRYSNIINSFSTNKTEGILKEVFRIDNPKESINNLLRNYLMFLENKDFSKDFYQELFDRLMIFNDEKYNIINPGTLIKLKNQYGLSANFDKYNEIIYGITYKKHSKTINTQYTFNETENTFDFLRDNNLKITDEVYDNKDVVHIVRTCKSNNIPLTQAIISHNWDEFQIVLQKSQLLDNLNREITENNINKLFKIFSSNELISIINTIIEKIKDKKDYYLLGIIKEKLKEKNIDDSIINKLEEDTAKIK